MHTKLFYPFSHHWYNENIIYKTHAVYRTHPSWKKDAWNKNSKAEITAKPKLQAVALKDVRLSHAGLTRKDDR